MSNVMSDPTAIRAAESKSDDDFRMLMHRLMSATQRLTLAVHALERQEDYGPASFVVEEAAKALDDLYNDFEGWDSKRRHTPKVVQS